MPRSRSQIELDLLEALYFYPKNGLLYTHAMYKVNLNSRTLNQISEEMEGKGLVKIKRIEGKNKHSAYKEKHKIRPYARRRLYITPEGSKLFIENLRKKNNLLTHS